MPRARAPTPGEREPLERVRAAAHIRADDLLGRLAQTAARRSAIFTRSVDPLRAMVRRALYGGDPEG